MHRAKLHQLFVKSNLGGDFTVLNSVLVNDLKKEGLWDSDMIDQLKYFNGELAAIEGSQTILSSIRLFSKLGMKPH